MKETAAFNIKAIRLAKGQSRKEFSLETKIPLQLLTRLEHMTVSLLTLDHLDKLSNIISLDKLFKEKIDIKVTL